MAIAPQDNDAFLREVDDNLRRDQLLGFVRTWGRAIAATVGILLLVLAASLWWRNYRLGQAGTDSESLTVALGQLQSGNAAAAKPALDTLGASPRDGYRATARIAQAGALQQANDAAGAAAAFRAIAADSKLPQQVRDLATIRAVAAEFDKLAPPVVIDRLKGLAVAGNPFFPSAGELSAVAWLKAGRNDKAAPLFAAVARDPQAPASLRGRAAAMATALGQTIEPTAPRPAP